MNQYYYPVGMSDCDKRGLNGECNQDCPVFLEEGCLMGLDFISGWIVTCLDNTGRQELEVGREYTLNDKPEDMVVIDGKEYLAERFDIKPIVNLTDS